MATFYMIRLIFTYCHFAYLRSRSICVNLPTTLLFQCPLPISKVQPPILKAVYNHCTGLVDWTDGLTQTAVKMPFSV